MTENRIMEVDMSKSGVSTSLVIMAAGIGSRFGQGIKQLTSFGPSGEIIMDYSIYDAVQAGFDRIVFVIRRDLEKDFREIIGSRIEKYVDTAYVFQEKENLPEGYTCPADRKKPWGTGQAILACRGVVKEPFCVINADDYYGKKAFKDIHDWLVKEAEAPAGGDVHRISMSGFILDNTLSDNGGVTRGICSVDADGNLTGINETKNITRRDGKAMIPGEGDTWNAVASDTLVSMNMWGFQPEFLEVLQNGFASFLQENLGTESELTAEYLLPTIVDEMLKKGEATVSVLPTDDRWFGVTYHEDIPSVQESFKKLVEDGVYPAKLWN